MALKRDHDSLDYSDAEDASIASSSKRQRKQTNKGKQHRQPTVDPTYGQKCAFPVLADLSDDDLVLEDQSEALAYLRSVQQETSRIPHVVVAPKAGPQLPPEYASDSVDRSIYQNGTGDSRGYYHDGAYTAAPDTPSSSCSEDGEVNKYDNDSSDSAAKNRQLLSESYFSFLTSRFASLRARLHTDPPQSALDSLPPEHETSVPSFGPNKPTFRTWTHRLRYTDPLPAQVAAMDKVSVLRLLRVVLGGKFFRRGFALRRRTSRWLWALLARLPDRGVLDADEVGAVRELGKRAVLVSISREHVVALCEVLGREQVEGLGLRGVLHEIEGRGERMVEEVAVAEDDGQLVPEDESGESGVLQDVDDGHEEDVDISPTNDTTSAGEADMDLEDGELPEEDDAPPEPRPATTNGDAEDLGEIDMDLEDGEVLDELSAGQDKEAAMEAMKARLLENLENVPNWEEPAPSPPSAKKLEKAVEAEDPLSDEVNMRATVNMILTVVGEFYGQRDLLAFRDPFAGVSFEGSLEDE